MNFNSLNHPKNILMSVLNQSFGIDKYTFIIKELHKRDVSIDLEYQRNFDAFCGKIVRIRNIRGVLN